MIHEKFTELLHTLAPFTEQELKGVEDYFEIEEVKKNAYVLKAGHVTARIGFVVSGILRTYYVVNNKEITTDLLMPGSIAAGMLSFLPEEPQNAYIVALENTVLNTITKDKLFKLYHENWKWQQVGRMLMEYSYIRIEDRSICLQTLTARGRYEHLLKRMPGVMNRVPLRYIASYLGIKPETFSRIRNK